MYISPLIVPVPAPAAAPLSATELERTGGTSTCWMPLRAWSWALIRAAAAAKNLRLTNHDSRDHDTRAGAREGSLPAAAAGSTGGDLESVGASRGLERGLRSRSRPESGLRAGGERERRSNRERRGSGSVWSKRDRFVLRRSESSIAEKSRGTKLAIGDR